MRISDYCSIARNYLKGRYGEAFIVTTLCLFVFVFFKSAAFIMIYAVGDMPYANLIETVGAIFSFIIMTPLMTGGFWWFFQTVCGGDNRSLLKLYSGLRLNTRAAILYALMWLKSFVSLIPSAVLLASSYVFLYGKTGFKDDVILFAAFQSIVLGIVFFTLYFSTFASMALAPFLFISHPDKNPFKVLRESAKMMRGRKIKFMKLMLVFLPMMLPLITIPFVMPLAAMSAAAFAKDGIENPSV